MQVLLTNIEHLRIELAILYEQALQESHQGYPSVMTTIHAGGRGRPRIILDRDWLGWALTQRTISGLAKFLGISRSTVREAALEYGLLSPGANPFPEAHPPLEQGEHRDSNPVTDAGQESQDDLLEPNISYPTAAPDQVDLAPSPPQPPRPGIEISVISDEDLDELIGRLRFHFRQAGVTMLHGMLRRLGHRIPHARIRQALLRIDPVRRVFERLTIRRRKYKVPGPNFLWHHDGQHGFFFQLTLQSGTYYVCLGLIRWKIVIHGFIDGHSRLVTGLRASNNNLATTVLGLFLDAVLTYGVPLRMRGDHGGENVLVAAWMEQFRGPNRGSYIWGRHDLCVRFFDFFVDYFLGVFITSVLNGFGSM